MVKNKNEIDALFSLDGSVAIITGGASGIGLQIGWAYAAMNAKVVLLDMNEENLIKAKEEMTAQGYYVETAVCDVSNVDMVNEIFDDVIDRLGKIDILVNSAGITMGKAAELHTAEEFSRILNVNVVGSFNCCLAASKSMISNNYGKIINIGSARGSVGSYIGHVAYGSSKAAVHMMTKQLATEWAKYHITSNCIIPNLTRTPIAQYLMQNKESLDFYLSRIPMRRPAETDDYVTAAIYFASHGSDFITGQLLYVDGGSMAG